MVWEQTLDNLPKQIPKKYQILIQKCHICCKGKFHNIPLTTKATIFNLRLGELLQIDFYFINVVLFRHFTSVLLIVDEKYYNIWQFCTPNKRPSIDSIKYFLSSMKQMGRLVFKKCTDLGGEVTC